MTTARHRILLVDDDPMLLRSLGRALSLRYEVHIASDTAQALSALAAHDVEVAVCDYALGAEDGVTLLREIAEASPTTIRILLTGEADLHAAAGAVNSGALFRLLLKPCDLEVVESAIADALTLHANNALEAAILTQTVLGGLKVMWEALGLANPRAFAHGNQIAGLVRRLAERQGEPYGWDLDVAANLYMLGAVTVPEAVLERWERGQPLTPEESKMIAEIPNVGASLLGGIPRLEGVAALIRHASRVSTPMDAPWPVHAIALAAEYVRLVRAGKSTMEAAEDVAVRRTYRHDLVRTLLTLCSATEREVLIHIEDLRSGMTFSRDLHTQEGALLVPAGQVTSPPLIERLCNFHKSGRIRATLHVRAAPKLELSDGTRPRFLHEAPPARRGSRPADAA